MLANSLYLTFHGIGEPVVPLAEGEGRYFVTRECFRQTVACLDALEKNSGIKAHLTFDDGNLSDYDVGFPTLLDHGRKAIFFVLAGRIGQEGYLSAAQIREMAQAGMTIGTHGRDHVDWRTLDADGRKREFVDARKAIEDTAGQAVTLAAIPFGRFDRTVLRHLRQEGYERAFTSSQGLALESAWFCPRKSPTADFNPQTDLEPLATPGAKVRGLAYAIARKLRYRF